MIHTHPFPARMAPEIALSSLNCIAKDELVLDPMSGSGMVISAASKLGIRSIGYDIDPLACMISQVAGTKVDANEVRRSCEKLIELCSESPSSTVSLSWMESKDETDKYIDFWFGKKQKEQLTILSYHLFDKPFISKRSVLNVIRLAMSRLIITKEPKASLARDTAHSRPHRTIDQNDFDVISAMPTSVDHVLRALALSAPQQQTKIFRGDARRLGRIADGSIDCIITSPPYLNAIDYMRGHRLALVWMKHRVGELRRIRSRNVGSECGDKISLDSKLNCLMSTDYRGLPEKKQRLLRRYFSDLSAISSEAARVLKPGKTATYVVGDSNIQGKKIRNSELLVAAASATGLALIDRYERDIPENRRYMPVKNSDNSTLGKRMRSEHVLIFKKL